MIKQLGSYIPRFTMILAASAALVAVAIESNAAPPSATFTFKLDQHDSVLNDQATLEILEAAIDAGILNPNDPQVQYNLSRAELQQYMSAYNAMCTLKTSAKKLRTQPTIAIGNGFEKSFNPASPNYDPSIKPGELLYFPSGNPNTFDRDADPNNLHATGSNLNIISFRLSLGATSNLYSFGQLPASNSNTLPMVVPGNTGLSSLLADGGNTLVVNFGNGGLLPGQMATMRIQLSVDNATPTSPWPSMTEFFSNDSMLTVVFQDPVTLAVTETNPVPFANFLQNAVDWQRQINTPLQHIDGYVPSFEIDGSFTEIPEPGTLGLAITGLAGYLLLHRRRAA